MKLIDSEAKTNYKNLAIVLVFALSVGEKTSKILNQALSTFRFVE